MDWTQAGRPPETSLARGVWSINISMLAFVVADTIIKFLGQSFPANELLFVRSLILVLVVPVAIVVMRRRISLAAIKSPAVVARCFFDCVNNLAFIAAVTHMQIAELYAIVLMSPFLMTIFAVFFFKEPIGYRRWLAIVGGFCGALLVIRPDPYALDYWALLGCVSAVAGAARETVTQKIDPNTPAIDVTFYAAIFVGVGTWLAGFNEQWLALTPGEYLLISVQAASWLVGALLLVNACRFTPLSIVAAFRYTMLIFGGLIGYLVFGDVPKFWSFIGAALIVGCGLHSFHREAVRQRTIASDVVTPH